MLVLLPVEDGEELDLFTDDLEIDAVREAREKPASDLAVRLLERERCSRQRHAHHDSAALSERPRAPGTRVPRRRSRFSQRTAPRAGSQRLMLKPNAA